MSDILSGPYAGFITSAYAITFVVLIALTLWIVVTHGKRKRQLAALEEAGLRRAGASRD